MGITLRTATSDDVAVIASFNNLLAEETEEKSLVPDTIQAGVAAVIGDASKGTYYLACDGSKVIGQLMLTYEWSDWRNSCFWWIQSVYVHQDYRQQGIYTQLYNNVKDLAKREGNVCGIRLYVEQNNQRAQTTYRKLGMDRTHYFIMEEQF